MKLFKIKIVVDASNIEYYELEAERSTLEELDSCWTVRLYDKGAAQPFFFTSVPKQHILTLASEHIEEEENK